jgi:hypothetical protein
MSTIYVDGSYTVGDSDGSFEKPFSTIASALDYYRADPANEFNILEILAGEYNETVDLQGTSGLTIRGAQAGVSAGVGGARDVNSTAGETVFQGSFSFGGGTPNVTGLTIDGLRLEGNAGLNNVRINGTIRVENTIFDIPDSGPTWAFQTVGTGSGHTIEFLNNTVVSANRGVHIQNGLIDSALVQGNVFEAAGGQGVLIAAGAGSDVSYVTIDGNEFSGLRGIQSVGGGSTIEGNVFNNLEYGIRQWESMEGGTISNNTFAGPGVGIALAPGHSPHGSAGAGFGVDISNNTFSEPAIFNETSSDASFGVNTIEGEEFLTGIVVSANSGDVTAAPIEGTPGSDIKQGTPNDDVFIASGGNDIIFGNGGTDKYDASHVEADLNVNLGAGFAFSAETGFDTLVGISNVAGGTGNDTIIGGSDDNTFFASQGNDTLDGVAGVNTYDASDASGSVFVNLLNGTAFGSGVGSDSLSNIQNIIGTSGGDFFVVGKGDNFIDGGDGNDFAFFSAASTEFNVTLSGANIIVEHTGGAADFGTNTLTNISTITFNDGQTFTVVNDGESIQDAIDSALPGATILVAAGTYDENLVIDKPLSLIGANSGVSGDGTRSDEAKITGSGTFGITILANDVTVDGFEISGFGRDAINVRTLEDAKPGDPDIGAYRANVTIANNFIHDDAMSGQKNGVLLGEFSGDPARSDQLAEMENITISGNLIELASSGARALAFTNHFTDTPGETITYKGITIDGNTIDSGNLAMFAGAPVSTFRFEDSQITQNIFTGQVNTYNQFNALVEGNTFNSRTRLGVEDSEIVNNIFNVDGDFGLGLWGDTWGPNVSKNSTVSDNTFNYNTADLGLTSTGGVALLPGVEIDSITFDNNTFNNGGAAVLPTGDIIVFGTNDDDVIDVAVITDSNGDPVSAEFKILGFDGDDVLQGGPGDDFIDGGDGTDIVTYDGNAADYSGSVSAGVITLTGPDGADTLVNIQALKFNDGFLVLDGMSIQTAIDLAEPGDTIFVSDGDFEENVNVNKDVKLVGANAGLAGDDAGRGAESTIKGNVTVSASGAEIDGFTFSKPDSSVDTGTGTNFTGWNGINLVVDAADVTVQNSVVEAFGAHGGFGGSGFVQLGGDGVEFSSNLVKAGAGYDALEDARGVSGVWVNGDSSDAITVANNAIEVSTANADGIFVNNGTATVDGNIISGTFGGIVAWSGYDALSITNNDISDYQDTGIRLLTSGLDPDVTVSGNTVGGDKPFAAQFAVRVTDGVEPADTLPGNTPLIFAVKNANDFTGEFGVIANGQVQLFTDLVDAQAEAVSDGANSVIYDFDNDEFLVFDGMQIAPALAAAEADDTIKVHDGTYDQLSIDKGVTLQSVDLGDGGATIVGNGTSQTGAIHIEAGVSGVTVDGFTIESIAGNLAGINAVGSNSDLTIINNTVSGDGAHAFLSGGVGGAGLSNSSIGNNSFVGSGPSPVVYVNGQVSNGVDSTNVDFTGNTITGEPGAGLLLGLEYTDGTVANNTFAGEASYASLELWGAGNTVDGNTFEAEGLQAIADPNAEYDGTQLVAENTFSTGTVYIESTGNVFTTIQAAVNAASAGDTLIVSEGVFEENVTLDKSITILGANAGVAGTDAARSGESMLDGQFVIAADNITIDGFQVDGGGSQSSGVRGTGTSAYSDVSIANSVFTGQAGQAILWGFGQGGGAGSENWSISDNLINGIVGNDASAMRLENINGLTISGNTIEHNDDANSGRRGIQLENVQNATIAGNMIDLGVDDFSDVNAAFNSARYAMQFSFDNGMATQNTDIAVTGNAFKGAYDGIVTLDGGVFDDVQFSNNTFEDFVFGIRLSAATNSAQGTQSNIAITGNSFDVIWGALAFDNRPETDAFSNIELLGNTYLGDTRSVVYIDPDNLDLSGTNTLEGSANAETILGGLGDDILIGGAGNDVINGRGGSDIILLGQIYTIDIDGNFVVGGPDDLGTPGYFVLKNKSDAEGANAAKFLGGAPDEKFGNDTVQINIGAGTDSTTVYGFTLGTEAGRGDTLQFLDVATKAALPGQVTSFEVAKNLTSYGDVFLDKEFLSIRLNFESGKTLELIDLIATDVIDPAFAILELSAGEGAYGAPLTNEALIAGLLNEIDDNLVTADEIINPGEVLLISGVDASFQVFTDIQSAVDAADDGDTIQVGPGTFTVSDQINVNKSIVFKGSGEGQTIIDASGVTNAYGISSQGPMADGVSFADFTLYGPANAAGNAFGLKLSGMDGVTVTNVTVQGSGRSEVDLNGVTNATLTNVTANGESVGNPGNPTPGVGFAISNSSNVTLTDISTDGLNAWGGVALFAGFGAGGTDNDGIVFAGDFNVLEPAPLYTQEADGSGNTVTIDTAPFTEVWEVTSDSFRSPAADSEEFTFLFGSEAEAVAFATTAGFADRAVIQQPNGEYLVADGMSIQAAVDAAENGNTIVVQSGNFDENVTINKAITIMGANAGVSATGTRDDESVIDGWVRVTADGAVLDGLQLTEGGTVLGQNTNLYVAASDLTVKNSVFDRDASGGYNLHRGIITEGGQGAGLTVEDSSFTGFATGVYLNPGAIGAVVTGNSFEGNNVGLSDDGPDAADISDNNFANSDVEHIGIGVLAIGATNVGAFIGTNSFDGTAEPVTIYALGSGQEITGSAGSDIFVGNANANTFIGGGGENTFNGGAGNETFFATIDDTVNAGAGFDTVVFAIGTDIADIQVMAGDNRLNDAEVIRIDGPAPGDPATFVVLEGMSIQEAIDAAASGDTVFVTPGSYTEDLDIAKGVVLTGFNAGLAGTDAGRGPEAFIKGQVTIGGSEAVTIDGVAFLNDDALPRPAQNLITVTSAAGHEISNSRFVSEVAGGNTGGLHDIAIFTNVLASGALSITNNFFGGDESFGSSDKYSSAAWGRAIWSNGGGADVEISGNQIENARTAINLENYAISNSTVDGNVIVNSGTGLAIGAPTAGTIDTITNNVFDNVDADFNLQNLSGAIEFDIGGTGNAAAPGQTLVYLGSQGNDVIIGTDGNDILIGNNGDDTLNGGLGNDILVGGGGNNVLISLAGDDTLDGSGGTDMAVIRDNGGAVLDLSEIDTAAFDGATGTGEIMLDGRTLDLTAIEVLAVDNTAGGARTFIVLDGMSIQAAVDFAEDGDTILVTDGTFSGDVTIDKSVTILGANAGVPGTGARDDESIVEGRIMVTADDVTIDGLYFDINASGAGGGQGVLTLAGSSAVARNNKFEQLADLGVTPNAILIDGDGASIEGNLIDRSGAIGAGSLGNPAISAGGVDNISISGNTLVQGIVGIVTGDGTGIDTGLEVTGNTITAAAPNNDSIFITGPGIGALPDAFGPLPSGFVTISGNTLTTSKGLQLRGTNLDDDFTSYATNRADRFDGYDGDDIFPNTGGNDILLGGDGDDFFFSGVGNNTIDGGGGVNTLSYAGLNTQLFLDLNSGIGQVPAFGRVDNVDNIQNIIGGDGGNTITGNSEANDIRGGQGNDILAAGGAPDGEIDFLWGIGGNNVLINGSGQTRMYGGAGEDIFRFLSVPDTGIGSGKEDRIFRFESGADLIDLSPILEDDSFSFIGSASYSGSGSPEVRVTQIVGGSGVTHTLVRGDVDGNGQDDFRILVANVSILDESDFIL